VRSDLEARAAVLVAAARDAIAAAVEPRAPRIAAAERDPVLRADAATFVTLRQPDATLRGCIGELEARRALIDSVRGNAVAAATRDPRFPPVTADEVAQLQIGISVLTPPAPIRPEQIEVGRHGLLVERAPHRGVLLPEVAVDQGWDAETFLSMTCRKAGLELEAWGDPETRVLAFETIKLP